MTAFSFVQYAGDGTIGPFAVPFAYLDRAHLSVQVDGAPAAFAFASASAVTLGAAAPLGSVVEIRRRTPADARLVDFTDGSVLTEADLDRALEQQLFLAQESFDLAATAITIAASGAYDAQSRRIVSLADPTSAQDAATRAYVDAKIAADIDVVAALVAAAETAEIGADDAAAASAASAAASSSSADASAASATAAAGSATDAADSATAAAASAADAAASAGGGASGVAGAVQFSDGSGANASDAANLLWDDTNNRLGVGTNAPGYRLHVVAAADIAAQIEGSNAGYLIVKRPAPNVSYLKLGVTSSNSGEINCNNQILLAPGNLAQSALWGDGGRLGIGTTANVASAALFVTSTTRGFLPPCMTTAQRAAIAAPAAGLIVHDTTLGRPMVFDGAAWVAIGAPSGLVSWFAAETPPAGWLDCDGSLLSRTTYAALYGVIGTVFGAGDGSTTFAIPDLRGEFVRGWDNGRGVDASRAFGSAQADEVESHNHEEGFSAGTYAAQTRHGVGTITGGSLGLGFDASSPFFSAAGALTSSTGGAETRPRNVALLPCIKY